MKFFIHVCTSLLLPIVLLAQGSVYLVLGSDTAIWDGLSVNKPHPILALELYTDPSLNTYKVMDPAFRDQFKDSYGRTMKMTWWMMAGNMYRFSTNTNVPLPNVMTMYLMKKYHGNNIKRFGDELSLHYHTFAWTDYNNDGQYFWNQAKNFNECKEDFNVTMAQYLLEENIFPASFRTGWHYMDNDWQNYIDNIIPYSMHNDYPAVRATTVEPIDNVFDWSKASKEFVPFHPSLTNYQLPGDGKSWNTRSKYMANFKQADMDSLFSKAKNGVDQLACLWAHLPEKDFPQNMKRIDSLAHISAAKYPAVKFLYCSAVEAMQRWRKGNDTIAPVITMDEVVLGDNVTFTIHTNEEIFQSEPFVAMKTVNEDYSIIHCTKSGQDQWTTASSILRSDIAKIGVAVTDTLGNVATLFKNFIPDDVYLDNLDSSYNELRGSWTTNSIRAWGTDSRQCTVTANDTASVQWNYTSHDSGMVNLFVQFPAIQNQVTALHFRILSNGVIIDSVDMSGPLKSNEWRYITTAHVQQESTYAVQMLAYGADQAGKIISADVIKLSRLVKERKIYTSQTDVYTDPVSEDDSTVVMLTVENRGIHDLTISSIYALNGEVGITTPAPLVIQGMKKYSIPLTLYFNTIGDRIDTIVFVSNDPQNPKYNVAMHFSILPYFRIVDNDDSVGYSEFGPLAKSVAQVWGASSRYALSGKGASARFTTTVKRNGLYQISEIVPTTVNAVTNALYIVRHGADTLGRVTIDQNKGSGNWVSIGQYNLTTAAPVEVKVIDNGPSSNLVLRADAVRVQLLTPSLVQSSLQHGINTFALEQNYPNPFNPSTTIRYTLPNEMFVSISVYDMLGRNIRSIVNEEQRSGSHTVQFDGTGLSSGMYIYRIRAGTFSQSKVMMLLK